MKCDHNKEIDNYGRCCCNCKWHIEDFHHCTTKKRTRTESNTEGCCCDQHKGWICMMPESERVYSGWSEHGLCEMHVFNQPKQ